MEELELEEMAKAVEMRVGTVARVMPMPRAKRPTRKKKGYIGLREGRGVWAGGVVVEALDLEVE
jgi:hypothetical protein